MPFTFLDTKTNSIQGVMVDLAQAIAKDQKVSIEVQGMPFSTLIPSLTSSKIDIIAAERAKRSRAGEHVEAEDIGSILGGGA